jgi:hypothetical protein
MHIILGGNRKGEASAAGTDPKNIKPEQNLHAITKR